MADRHLVEPRTCRSGSSNRASLQLFRVLHLKGALFFALFQFQKKVTTGVATRSSRIRMGLSGSRLFRRLFLFRSRCLDACSGLRLLHFRGGLSTVIGAVCHRGCNRQSEDSGSHEYDFHICLPIIWVWHCSGSLAERTPPVASHHPQNAICRIFAMILSGPRHKFWWEKVMVCREKTHPARKSRRFTVLP